MSEIERAIEKKEYIERGALIAYCPNCGAKMDGEKEGV